MNNFYLIKDWLNNFRNSNFRHLVWPIRSSEFSKFLPMAILMFIILLNSNLIRVLKDSLIITSIGPEVISFIRLWCEMPAGILFVIIYSKLCNVMTTQQVFSSIITFFLSFFIIFAFILYPYQNYIHPDLSLVKYYTEQLPHFKWFIIIWAKWSFVLFYVMGELWPIIVFTLLFWQLANQIIKTEQAKRFYPFFSLFGQSNLLISGVVIGYFIEQQHFLLHLYGYLEDKTEIIIKSIVTVTTVTGLMILYLHYNIVQRIYNKNVNHDNKKLTVLNLSLKDSMRMVMQSKYLGLICILIVSYNITIIIIEGVWMSKVKALYTTPQDFIAYQSNVLFFTGVFSICCAFIGTTVISKYGWFVGAIATPVLVTIAGALFFITCTISKSKLEIIAVTFFYSTPLMIIVFIGGVQNVLAKGIKYSLFDATKEMSYIPLDDEIKTKGKAAVDIIGTKIGKLVGSIIPFIIFSILPTVNYENISGFLAIVFIIVCFVWILGVKALAKEYSSLLKKDDCFLVDR